MATAFFARFLFILSYNLQRERLFKIDSETWRKLEIANYLACNEKQILRSSHRTNRVLLNSQ